MAIQKPSSSSSKQKRNKAPVAKKCRGGNKNRVKKQQELRFSDVPECHAAECCETDLYQRRHEIWYSREDYTEFHKDRFETIQRFRASGGDITTLDQDSQCVRGLEPFWTPQGHRELQGSRKLHKSTVMLEQARQNLTRIKDPQRFRIMVAPQSDLAQKRAQELAVLDELEAKKVYNPSMDQTTRIPRNHPAFLSMSCSLKEATENLSLRSNFRRPSLSLSESQQIRALQEHNARRLMQMYSCNQNNSQVSFRFPIRRDSLVGGARFIHAMMISQQNGV